MIEEIRNKLSSYGLNPENIVTDGNIHRFKATGKGQSGWYVFFVDGNSYGGSFGDWAGLDPVNISEANGGDSEKFKEKMHYIRMDVMEEKAKLRIKAEEKANSLWGHGSEVVQNEYLENKKVNAYGIKEHNNHLLIPVKDNGKIKSLQIIAEDGGKKFLTGGEIKGNAFKIPGDLNIIYVCEGYSTGATIHELTGNCVICAFNAGNLKNVCKKLRSKLPNKNIIVACDNDRLKEKNVGLEKGQDAANSINAKYIFPEFKGDKGTDFNDLFVIEGFEIASSQLTGINYNLFSQIKRHFESAKNYISKDEICRHFGFSEKSEKDMLVKILDQMCAKEIILQHSHKAFNYKIFEAESEELEQGESETLDISLPFNLHEFVNIYKGNVIIIAGDSNAGKTAATLMCMANNIYRKMKTNYISSEMSAQEYRDRVNCINNNQEFWSRGTFLTRNKNFDEAISRGRENEINIIDYLEPNGPGGYAELEQDIMRIHSRLKDGIAIICIQKTKDNELGRGGDGTKAKARLYLSLSQGYKCADGGFINICKIIKAKSIKDHMKDVDGTSCFYKASAKGIEKLSLWQFMNKKTKDLFLEQLKEEFPAAENSEAALMRITNQ